MSEPSKFHALLQLMRLDKPIGTLLLLWPTLGALWIAAGGVPDFSLLVIFVAGTFLTRSAGCIINDLADRHWDGAVERTSGRPLVTGAVSTGEARGLFVLLMLAAFVLVLFTNRLTVLLSVAAVLLASAYPFMKRYTHLPQLVLGAAFSWGIPMAFAAQRGQLPHALWLLYLGNLLWTVVYDTQYAMVDREDDLAVGIKSTAILFGAYDRLAIGILQLACLLVLYAAGKAFALGSWFFVGLLAAAGLFAYHQYLIRERQRDACFRAFLHNNWVGMVIFLGIALSYC
ncbi:MAG: 4-hydroxybenzoate octaprenyltransferase [Pseudomonadales bacterium]|nr:4-hydroxybenzoate octaprenyltransferase [Halieaceae bacterium]MCP5163570.1 4-hydroxybenzoate octaprenyltransferase [Pseudomonadales bacterium]MCP5189193.1 4-hydroxybenzoate octaprenyltransferase [Pseudomonadales bacterium]MCP5204545.1 4-hydroxybenzoate octaprenyltransferase [Pseudomonadales bacterium]